MVDNRLDFDDPQIDHLLSIYHYPDCLPYYFPHDGGCEPGQRGWFYPKPRACEHRAHKYNIWVYIYVGMLGSFIGTYIGNVALNIFRGRRDIFTITRPIPIYYSATVVGGLLGILALYLNPDLLVIAAILMFAVFNEAFLRLAGYAGTSSEEFVYIILRNIITLLVLYRIIDVIFVRNRLTSADEDEDRNLIATALLTSAMIKTLFAFNDFFLPFSRVRAALGGGHGDNRKGNNAGRKAIVCCLKEKEPSLPEADDKSCKG
jgi:hypothetical protein